ncbi:MAG: hypothetical protein RLZZ595_812 [Bacteroidota bacterium]|jgi:hypothetical protein
MKLNKNTLLSFLMLVFLAAVYRAIPGRPWGFAPQFAMAIFGGAVFADKKLSFFMPILSLLISDVLYEFLYINGISEIKGFYDGMWINYLLFGSLTIVGFFIQPAKISSIAKGAIAAPTLFFLTSNFITWAGNGGYQRGKTFAGLMQTYMDGIPFYGNSLVATVVFSTFLFGAYHLMVGKLLKAKA